MKKILLTALLLVPFANANSKNIEVLDYSFDAGITVYCISGYVFVELSNKKSGGALTQVMRSTSEGMSCKYYMKELSKK